MILYHGTTAEKGKQIIENMYIKAYIKRNYIDYNDVIKNTTNGFVYLTVQPENTLKNRVHMMKN